MRVLFINANKFKQPWPVIPFGLCCVASAVESAGHEVFVLDLCFSKNCFRDISNSVNKLQPSLIGISIRNIDNSAGYNTLFLLEKVKDEVIGTCKKVFFGPIVIGGPAVGISGAEMLSFLDLEFAIRGDGEDSMVEFVNRLEKKLPLNGLGGLVRRKKNRIVEDNPPMLVKDLDSLPCARPHRYIDLRPYRKFDSPLQIQTKRGCPLKCTYCTYNRIEGLRYRLRNPQRVADEIECLVQETGINHIEFTDSTFNIPLNHAKAVLRAVAEKELDLNLRTMGVNPGAVDRELADLMKRVGFRDVDLGAEAGCDAMLRSLGKNFNKDDLLRAGKILHERGIPITWYLLVGAPGETDQTLKETFETTNRAASKWDLVNIGVGIRVYNGAPIANRMRRETPSCTNDNFLKPVHYSPEAITLDAVKAITKRIALKHPNYFMYDEDENTPPIVLMIGTGLLKIFAPKQPIWKLHICLRTLQKMLGISFLKRVLFDHKNRNQ
ncbi:MAG: radical SAM protein [Proteobacteria bacterium]|nr:radical SAM protein [Pseudomonadota bacterium]